VRKKERGIIEGLRHGDEEEGEEYLGKKKKSMEHRQLKGKKAVKSVRFQKKNTYDGAGRPDVLMGLKQR